MKNEEKKIVQKVVLGGVVVKDGKVLILQRQKDEDIYPNMWELPSGKREESESSEAALLREVREESGLEVEIVAPVSTFEYRIEKPDEIQDCTQFNFLVKPVSSKEIVLSDEHQAFAWVTPAELERYDLTEATKGVIKKAFEKISVNI